MSDYNKEFGKRLKKARTDLGLTMKELGSLVDLHESTIKRYEDGNIRQLDIVKAEDFAAALKMDRLTLLGWEVSDEYNNSVLIPVYGSIPAGIPLEAIEDIQGQVDIPADWLSNGREYIALKVIGDSMYPKYLDGDTVIIQLQPDCESGQDCACYVNGFNATLKTVKKGYGKIELKPYNPNYPPQTYNHPGEVTIIGVVKQLRRNL